MVGPSRTNSNKRSSSVVPVAEAAEQQSVTMQQLETEKEPSGQKKPNILVRVSHAVDAAIQGFFGRMGRLIARHPWKFIIVMVVFFVACAFGFAKFEQEEDATLLFTPSTAQGFEDEEYVRSVWGANQQSKVSVFGVTPVEGKPVNVLEKARLLELMRMYDEVTSATVTVDGKKYAYGDVCARYGGAGAPCRIDSILEFWSYSRATLEADTDVVATINTPRENYLGRPLSLDFLLGGNVRDAQGRVVSSEASQTLFFTFYNESRAEDIRLEDPVEMAWQDKIVEITHKQWKSDQLELFVINESAISEESSNAINSDVMLLSIGYILVVVYTHWSLWRNSKVYQKIHMATAGFLAIGMSIVACFGLVSAFGQKFNGAVQTLPFLLVGVGVDDVFIIIGAYFQQDLSAPAEKRISGTLASAGASITVTSLTTFVAFLVGMWTSLPALEAFCAFASCGIAFLWLFMVTFFIACLSLEARREERALRGFNSGVCGFTCCCVNTADHECPVEEGPSGSGPSQGGDLDVVVERPGLQKMEVSGVSAVSAPLQDFSTDRCCACCGGPEKRFDPKKPTIQTRIVADWLPKVTLTWWGKALVLALEAGMIVAAGIGISKLKTDFRYREWFVPSDSWLQDSFAIEQQYFGGNQSPFSVYTKTSVDWRGYFYYQDQLAAITRELREEATYVATQPPVHNWYDDFLAYLPSAYQQPDLTPEGRPSSEPLFQSMLQAWLQGEGRYAQANFQFFPNGTIESSKVDGFSDDIVDGSWAQRYVEATRRAATQAAPGLRAIAYGPNFPDIDGFGVIAEETIRNLITAGIVVYVIILLVLASIPGSLLVGTMVVLCDVGLLGFMHWIGLTFNSVTSIIIVLAIGIAVDYSAHICRAFLVAKGTRQERAHAALRDIGGEVLDGAFTTLLVICVMGAAQHYIFTTFFALFFALIILAIWHGIVLLPVLLSLIGPASIAIN